MKEARPTATELLDAVAAVLGTAVERGGRVGSFEARVAANVVRIVERELRLGPAIDAAAAADRAALPGAPTDAATLAELIRRGEIASDDPALLAHLRRDVCARIAVDNPSYLSSTSRGEESPTEP